jgi:hypothetical protein
LVQQIVATGGHADIQLGKAPLRRFPVAGGVDHARQTPLQTGFLLFNTAIGVERRRPLASRGGGQGGYPQVNTYLSHRGMHGRWDIQLNLQGYNPVLALSGDGDVNLRTLVDTTEILSYADLNGSTQP